VEGAWPIVLDLNLWTEYFDLAAYRSAVEGRIPASHFERLPETNTGLSALASIWLELRVHRRSILVPFNVTWSKYLGVAENDVAYLVPIELYNGYDFARNNPDLCLFLDGGPSLAPRVMSVRSPLPFGMSAAEKAAADLALAGMARPWGLDAASRGTRSVVDFSEPFPRNENGVCDGGVPSVVLAEFATDLGLDLPPEQVGTLPSTRGVMLGKALVEGPCDRLSSRTLAVAETRGAGEACTASVPVATTQTGFSEMVMYAPDRLSIRDLVEFINCRHGDATAGPETALCVVNRDGELESRLMINQIYEDSLNRFGFLTELLRAVSGPVGLAMVFLLVAILSVQLGTVLGHRRVRYAMLLSSGISLGQTKFMVITQTLLSALVGFMGAIGVFVVVSAVLFLRMAQISLDYEMITLGLPIDVLPAGAGLILLVMVGMLISTVILTLVQFRLNGLASHVPLERLLS